jgi:hypothetical protein
MREAVGTDPGGHGALARISEDRKLIKVYRFSTMKPLDFRRLLYDLTLSDVAISLFEKNNSRPGEKNRDKMASNAGKAEFLLELSCGFQNVQAQTWQYAHGLGGKQHTCACPNPGDKKCKDLEYSARKASHWSCARELFADRKVLKDEADAMLIADYGWQLAFQGGMTHVIEKPVSNGVGIVRISEPRIRYYRPIGVQHRYGWEDLRCGGT